jgi:lysyl-tRNA synthetase class 2
MPMFLRIAPELYLKRLVVGGFERVFEINRNFRNEGVSTRHNPEFTMLEFYQAYADYRDLMDLTERLLRDLARRVLGSTELTYQGQRIDFAKPFARYTLAEAITTYLPRATPAVLADLPAARALALELGLVVKDDDGLAQVQLELFEKVVEEQLIQPTFVTDFPVEVSPLARRRADDPALTERFELFIAGRELANGFSELNDPEDQAARFLEQAARKAAGDEEAMYFDADYVEALEYGLPPTAGEGIGVDRLAMLFADVTSIREVILFPHLRPQRPGGTG